VSLGGTPPDASERLRDALVQRNASFDAGDLLRMLGAITELEPRFRKSGQQQLLLEAMLVRFALLDRTVSIEAVLRGLGAAGPSTNPPHHDASLPRRDGEAGAGSCRLGAAKAGPSLRSGRQTSARSSPCVGRQTRRRARAGDQERPAIPDVSQLAERWDDVVKGLRKAGRTWPPRR